MSSLNRVTLIGRLGRDPETKHVAGGSQCTSFSLATDERWKDTSGTQQQRTEWHRIITWGKLAEICGQYLCKGKQVYIEGRLQTREWEDKDGNTRRTTEIVAREMIMLGSKGDGPGMFDTSDTPRQAHNGGMDDDDIPF